MVSTEINFIRKEKFVTYVTEDIAKVSYVKLV